jgi:hypothetical protein
MPHLARACLLLALASAEPAAAQFVGRPNHGIALPADPFLGNGRLPAPSIGRELGDIRDRIEDARETGAISARQARGFRREARVIGSLAGRYSRNGLSDAERTELTARALYLREAVSRVPQARQTRRNGRGL